MSGASESFRAEFSSGQLDLSETWHLEGEGRAWVDNGRLAVRDEADGVVLWIKRNFPDGVRLRFDLAFSNNRGLGVFFIAAKGTQGEDVLSGLPERTGKYGEYTKGQINCYGFSLHRFFPDGRHNPGINLRKNRGFHIVSHAEPDPMKDSDKSHSVVIEKQGNRIQMRVDGDLVHDWEDEGEHGKALTDGKIGFRLRGDPTCRMYLDNIEIDPL